MKTKPIQPQSRGIDSRIGWENILKATKKAATEINRMLAANVWVLFFKLFFVPPLVSIQLI
jgi:hypothetical protein